MQKRYTFIFRILFVAWFFLISLSACNSSSTGNGVGTQSNVTITVASTDGQALMLAQCSKCHPLSRVTSKQKTASEWKVTVDRMISRGAKLTSQEESTLIQYLAQNY